MSKNVINREMLKEARAAFEASSIFIIDESISADTATGVPEGVSPYDYYNYRFKIVPYEAVHAAVDVVIQDCLTPYHSQRPIISALAKILIRSLPDYAEVVESRAALAERLNNPSH